VPATAVRAPVVQPVDSFKQPLNTSLFRPPVAVGGNQFAVPSVQKSSNVDLLFDLAPPPTVNSVHPVPPAAFSAGEWDDFSGFVVSFFNY